MRLVYDIETDGLDHSRIWIICAIDVDTGEEYIFTDHDNRHPDLEEFKPLFDNAKQLIGHNIIAFDGPALKKHTGWEPTHQAIIDTMLLSQLNDFYRPSMDDFKTLSKAGSHALGTWAKAFGDTKPDNPNWDEYSDEMLSRCVEDVRINVKVYKYLMKELQLIREQSPGYGKAVKLEHEFAKAMAEQRENGWYFDAVAANKIIDFIDNRMTEIEKVVEPQLKPRLVYLDKEPRKPQILKDGRYDKITRDYFKVEMSPDPKVPEEYQRTKLVTMTLSNNDAVINFLLENGWKPTEWNRKKVDGGWRNVSPKLTEDSYDSITGEYGQMVAEWRTLRSRKALLEGMLRLQRPDGRISADAFTIGTNTFRCRHRNIVNIPGAFAVLGKEVRECFTCEEGRVIVSADSSGNQARAMAHYVNNEEVTNEILNGDLHQRNADYLGVPRNIAKNVLYATMFGAGDAKLGQTANQRGNGKEVRAKMMKSLDGLERHLRDTQNEYEANLFETGRGFVLGLDGRRVFCDDHKAFNAQLQCFEAVTCKAAAVEAQRIIKQEKLDAKIIAHVHDEVSYDVDPKDAGRVAEILEYAFGDFITREYSLNIQMAGEAATGSSWFEVH